MRDLPHEIERLGPELRMWLEQQLLADLRHYGVDRDDCWFDWSGVVQEGHWMEYRGRTLESVSDVEVRGSTGELIAKGWMDFVTTSTQADAEPRVFWLFLSIVVGGEKIRVKSDAWLPSHVWNSFTHAQRQHIASGGGKWLRRDPKVQEWRLRNSTAD